LKEQNPSLQVQHTSLKEKEEEKFFEKLQDTATMDYLWNVFVKYLIYLAWNLDKEARTLEKVLFTVLNVPIEQEKRVEKARKKSKFWKLLGKLKKSKGETDLEFDGHDKDLNYTFNTEADCGSSAHFDDPIFESGKKDPQIKERLK